VQARNILSQHPPKATSPLQKRGAQGWTGALLFILLLPLILLFLAGHIFYGAVLHVLIWFTWLPRGKFVLLVTSDSPVWKQYMADRILSRVEPHAIVLNWSERQKWLCGFSLPAMAFRFFGGRDEFNPLAVVFRPFRLAKTYRFWGPFKDYKHGNPAALEKMTKEVLDLAERIGPPKDHAAPC